MTRPVDPPVPRSAPPAPAVLSAGDREAAERLTSAAQQVTSAVSEAGQLTERLTDQLLSHQRQLATQVSQPENNQLMPAG